MTQQDKLLRECEDCREEIPVGQRRHRCQHCGKLICHWCFGHTHCLREADYEDR